MWAALIFFNHACMKKKKTFQRSQEKSLIWMHFRKKKKRKKSLKGIRGNLRVEEREGKE